MADYVVTVDRSTVLGTSKFRTGANWIDKTLNGGFADAESAGAVVMGDCLDIVCSHIQRFGSAGPWWAHTETEAQMHWAPSASNPLAMDKRVQTKIDQGCAVAITFSVTPDWMSKPVGDWSLDHTSGFQMNAVPADTSPDTTHFDDMAEMARRMVVRINSLHGAGTIERVHMWNEYKGFFSQPLNRYRYEDMTSLYLKVYDAIKGVDSSIQMGGLYPSLQTTDTTNGPAPDNRPWFPHNKIVLGNGKTVDPRFLEAMLEWRDGISGKYDFVCVDGANSYVADVVPWLEAEFPGKDIYWNEFYSDNWTTTLTTQNGAPYEDKKRADLAVNLISCVKNRVSSAYLWQPERRWQDAGLDADSIEYNDQGLWTSTERATTDATNPGGQRTATADLLQNLKENFGPGTILRPTTIRRTSDNAIITDGSIVALASSTKVMVVNRIKDVNGNGVPITVDVL